MVLRFYHLEKSELDQLYNLEDQFPDEVTVGETRNALAGEQYVELIVGLAGPVFSLVLELIKLWTAKKKEKEKEKEKKTALTQNVIENLEIEMLRPDGTQFAIRAERIPAKTAEHLLDSVGMADDD